MNWEQLQKTIQVHVNESVEQNSPTQEHLQVTRTRYLGGKYNLGNTWKTNYFDGNIKQTGTTLVFPDHLS